MKKTLFRKVDPLTIVNDFFTYGVNDPPWPYMTLFDDYWGKKVCALAERCAKAENGKTTIPIGKPEF